MIDTTTLSTLAVHTYGGPNPPPLPPGIQAISIPASIKAQWGKSGFSASLYRVTATNELVVAFRGTELSDSGDLASCAQLASGGVPAQYWDARDFYRWVRDTQAVPGDRITLTGHSLGGALAQILRLEEAQRGVSDMPTVTFGAPGVLQLQGVSGNAAGVSDVTNYVTPFDPIGHWGTHLGAKIVVPSLSDAFPRGGGDGLLLSKFLNAPHSSLTYEMLFIRAAVFTAYSPLVLDLDGDGVETRAASGATFFDHRADGFAERTGWVGADDGLLALDRDADGLIESGRELFGTGTQLGNGGPASNGFQALAELDADHDGKIDARDPAWAQLRIWRDADGDGVSRADELLTPAALGIAGLGIGHTSSSLVDAQGNAHRELGSFTWSDGRTGALTDVWFAAEPAATVATSLVPVSDAVAALPDLPGRGQVHGLHQAMARDGSGHLRDLVERFGAAVDGAERGALVEQILLAWTGAEAVSATGRGPNVDGRKLAAMERLHGQDFASVDGSPSPNVGAGPLLVQAWDVLVEMVHAQLMAQTHLQDLVQLITYRWDATAERQLVELAAVEAELVSRLVDDPVAGAATLSDFARLVRGLGAEGDSDFWAFRERFAARDEGLRWAVDAAGRTLAAGTGAGDALTGTSAADAIRGGDGDDSLSGGAGRDTLHGDAGADQLYGGEQEDLLVGGAGNDVLTGGEDADRLEGGAGTDTLVGDVGDDVLLGGAGADALNGGDGADVLDGGPGDDSLDGSFGDDTYLFGRGSGHDAVFDQDWQLPDTDRVLLAADVTPADTLVRREQDDLIVSIRDTGDQLRVNAWFLEGFGSAFEVQRIEFLADGTVWDAATIRQMLLAGTAGADTLVGYSSPDTVSGLGGDDVLAGRSGDDALDGGPGRDAVGGDDGNDVVMGGDGDDTLGGGYGNDVLDGGRGDDWLDGGFGDDVYRFGRDGGHDMVEDWDWQVPDTDRVVMAADVAPSEVRVTRSGADLVLAIDGTDDQITVRSWFGPDALETHELARVEFADGTVWDVAALEQLARTIQGTPAADVLTGTASAETLRGLAGDDVLRAGAGADRLDGGPGADALYGETGDDTYVVDVAGDLVVETAGQGIDTVESAIDYTLPAEVEQLVLSGPGPLRGTGNGLANTITGNPGANVLDGGAGADTLAGGAGDDVYVVDHTGDRVTEAPGQGRDTIRASVTFTLPGDVEDLTLTGTAAVNGTGNALANAIAGNGAANVLDGATGADAMTGGLGNDTYVVDHAGDTVVEATGGGTDTVKSAVSYVLPANVEKLVLTGSAAIAGTGNGLANTLTGNGGSNVLTGGLGNDLYEVQNATDVVVERPGEGTDTVNSTVSYALPDHVERLTLSGSAPVSGTGNSLANAITGNTAANTLDGGAGNDTLTGGRGGDTYLFTRGTGRDAVVENDTSPGAVDVARFGAGLRPLDLILSQSANDLLVEIPGGAGASGAPPSSDIVTVKDWFRGAAYQVEAIDAGGQRLVASHVALLIQDMAQWSASQGMSWAQGLMQEPADVQGVLSAHWQPA